MRIGQETTLKALAVLLAISLLAVLAVACGGGGGGGQTPAAGDTPQADDGEGDNGGGGEGLGDLEDLAAKAAEGVIAKITYKYSTEAGGQTVEGEWVLVRRPPDSRFELALSDGGEEVRSVVINSGGKSYLCTSGGGEESCLAVGTEDTAGVTNAFDPLFDIPRDIAEEAAGVNLVDQSERTIAGLDASCFTVKSTIAGLSDGEVCFSDDGLLLLLRSESDEGSVTFEATSASTDVTDDDFEPPYDVLDLPDLEIPTP